LSVLNSMSFQGQPWIEARRRNPDKRWRMH